jgi:thiamine-monophosphate kinase
VTRRTRSEESLALGAGPEFDRIRKVFEALGSNAPGLGDDCGLIPTEKGFLTLSTDVSVEGIHFRLDWIGHSDVGWRCTAAALSDLAAEGADAVGVLCAVTMPARAPESQLVEVMTGVGAATTAVGGQVLGGDLSVGPVWSLAITVIGRAVRPVPRSGAKPGDRLWVTGSLGGSRAALESWRRGEEPPPSTRQRYARPEPRIAAGRWLAEHGARAMIDLSDGLAGDALHVAVASSVALELDLNALPVVAEVTAQAARFGVTPQHFAAEGGEDFELLVAMAPDFNAAAEFTGACGIPLTPIGSVSDGAGVRFLQDGAAVALSGYNHFG